MSTREVRALRGATTVAVDGSEAIEDATETVLREMIERNGVDAGDIISLVFTATPDLTAAFPAAAARRLGLGHVPLLCAQEIPVPGAMPRVVRVLMHLYTDRDYASLRHVYLGDARKLREDLPD
jgi:chorismate mutase